jgi:hypothetical protein
MNMRKRKQAVMLAMYYITANAQWDRWLYKILQPTPAEIEEQKARTAKVWEDLKADMGIHPEPDQPQIEKIWKVARVKDDVVVLEAKSLEEAKEAIQKAARQKKAKLHLLDDEPYVFEFE